MDNNTTLSAARALIAQEEAQAQQYIWEAVIATHNALVAEGFTGLPSVHVERAKAVLMRAGAIDAGELPDTELRAIAVTTGTRIWSEIVGTIYKNEQITDGEGNFYICLQQHTKQADWAPGATGIHALFRPVRSEPEDGAILDFVWGEFVPFGVQRRDPIDNKIYTPSAPTASPCTSHTTRTWFRRSMSKSPAAAEKAEAAVRAATHRPQPTRAGLTWRKTTPSPSATTSPTTARPTKCFAYSRSRQTGGRLRC